MKIHVTSVEETNMRQMDTIQDGIKLADCIFQK